MITTSQIRAMIQQLTLSEISLDDFEEWLTATSWNMRRDSEPEAVRAVGKIELFLAEMDAPHISEAELLKSLADLAGIFKMGEAPAVRIVADSSFGAQSIPFNFQVELNTIRSGQMKSSEIREMNVNVQSYSETQKLQLLRGIWAELAEMNERAEPPSGQQVPRTLVEVILDSARYLDTKHRCLTPEQAQAVADAVLRWQQESQPVMKCRSCQATTDKTPAHLAWFAPYLACGVCGAQLFDQVEQPAAAAECDDTTSPKHYGGSSEAGN
ncbi:MAG: hypothetical protein ABSC47_08980 [Terracidiphilus sp.]